MTALPISFEFSAPKTEAAESGLRRAHNRLKRFDHEFVSVTYGAGGSTRDGTKKTVLALNEDGVHVAPHMSFGGNNSEAIEELLTTYKNSGIRRIVALRGDRQSGIGSLKLIHASELIRFIRAKPATGSILKWRRILRFTPNPNLSGPKSLFLKKKWMRAPMAPSPNTSTALTPTSGLSRNPRKRRLEFRLCRGIMPITNLTGLQRFSQICGADLPRWLVKRLEDFDDDDALKDFGAEVVTRLCEQLIQGGAPALHFYTLNQSKPSARILNNLGF